MALGYLGGACGLLGDSWGCSERPRRDANEALEGTGELALVREPGPRRDLCQGQVTVLLQELPGPLDAAQDDELVRGQPGGCLELPGEVVDAEASDRGDLPQGR